LENGPIVLGLPKGRVTLPIAHTFTALDKDWDAIDAAHSGQTLFDFGLGRRYSRFGVRASGKLAVELQIVVGQSWCAVLALLGGAIIAESPTRVVESELARIEVFSPIPIADGKSPAGAHTHFLPQFLLRNEEIPPALALPEYAAPVGIFYPA
jgi:hypothetical protein